MWVLVITSHSPRSWVGAVVFGTCVCLLYAGSATYHLWPRSSDLWRLFRRLDHATIFLFIAGTYTPFALKALGNGWGIPILSVIWALGGIGCILTVALPWARPRWLAVGLYLAMGWTGLITIPKLLTVMSPGVLAIMAVGGLIYSLGAVVYALKRPDPLPRLFGYHEVFHAMVLVATGVFYWVIVGHVLPL